MTKLLDLVGKGITSRPSNRGFLKGKDLLIEDHRIRVYNPEKEKIIGKIKKIENPELYEKFRAL